MFCRPLIGKMLVLHTAVYRSCSTYCNYLYCYYVRHRYTGDETYDTSRTYYYATGCGTYLDSLRNPGRSLCSAIVTEYSDNYDDPFHESYWSRSTAVCSTTASSTSQCPKGWGNLTSYNSYSAGCHNGSYYPNATAAYSGPSPSIGSTY